MTVTVGQLAPVQDRSIKQGPRHLRRRWEPIMITIFSSQGLERAVRRAGVALTVAATIAVLSPTASFAFSAEAQQMCSGDAFRLCSAEIPNIPRITACMVKNRSQLSSGCRIVLDRDLAAQRRAAAE
ncbi:hypothetical protein [Bradyrhizobium macuxiense]